MKEVGIDIIEIDRIKKAMQRRNFLKRILGEDEYKQLDEMGFPAQSLAGNFCAKEAFSKAVGTGFRGIKFKEIQLIRDEKNKPVIKLSGNAFCLYGDERNHFSVSISHTKTLACAVVLFERGGKTG